MICSSDEVLEVNGLKLCGKSVHDICSTLCQVPALIIISIIPMLAIIVNTTTIIINIISASPYMGVQY